MELNNIINTNIRVEEIRKKQLEGLNRELKSISMYLNSPNIIIFGAGQYGINALNMLKTYNLDRNIKAFCDNDKSKQGMYISNFKILNYFEIKKLYITPPPLFLICSKWWDEIEYQLKKYNEKIFFTLNGKYQYISREILGACVYDSILKVWNDSYDRINFIKIKQVHEILNDKESKNVLESRMELIRTSDWSCLAQIDTTKKQYFLKEIFKFNDKEVFLDIGALNGDTIFEFTKVVNYSYKKIIAFEPNEDSYKELIENLHSNGIENIDTYNIGIWSEKTVLNFLLDKSSSNINSSGNCKIDVDSLDNLFLDIPITFIKMDIEGAEKEALLGAKKVIKKYKPKLAICVYHKIDDIYEIPLLIKSLVPEYKIYLRHHSQHLYETVCYACI